MQHGERLAGRLRDRDVSAFEEIYDRYHRLVYGVALRILGDRPAAEDCTQAVFLNLWHAPERFHGGNFDGWLARVARNRALDAVRARSVRDAAELPDDVPDREALDDTVFALIDGARVRAALTQLPAEQREPIELGFFGGLTHEEIAARSGTPLGTVKTRIRTGLRRLRNALGAPVA